MQVTTIPFYKNKKGQLIDNGLHNLVEESGQMKQKCHN